MGGVSGAARVKVKETRNETPLCRHEPDRCGASGGGRRSPDSLRRARVAAHGQQVSSAQAPGGSSGEEAFTSRVFKGAFRFVSGLIAKKKRENVRITVAVATIGIRGTHFEGEVTERQQKDGKTADASAKVAPT